jgi:hypothetical protein
MGAVGGLRSATILCAVLISVTVPLVPAQTAKASPDAGPYRGKVVSDPESLSGLWETSNGQGGFVGIHMILGTSVAPDAKTDGRTLNGVEQQWEYLTLGVYEQKGAEFSLGEGNYFSDSAATAAVRIEDGHLVLHFVSPATGMPAVDLDLWKKEGDRWVGRFHRASFDEQVTLNRPGGGMKTHDAITGVWTSSRRVVHIGEQKLGQFAGWSDVLQIPGTIRFAPGIKPGRFFETYGDRVKVRRAGERGVLFEFGAYSVNCCPRTAAGILSNDGREIKAGDTATPFSDWKKRGE